MKRAALSDPRIAADIRAFFDTSSDELRLHQLERAQQRAPDSAVTTYLLGRRLLALNLPAEAEEALGKAVAGALPDVVAREAWRLLIAADYQAGDCAAVRADLGRMPDLATPLRGEVTEWQARCDFEGRSFNGPLVPRRPFR